MFGKKQNGPAQAEPKKKVEKKPASVQTADKINAPKMAPQKIPEGTAHLDEMLDGLDDVLPKDVPPKPAPQAPIEQVIPSVDKVSQIPEKQLPKAVDKSKSEVAAAGEDSAGKKPLKDMNADMVLHDAPEEAVDDLNAKDDSVTSLRLQRCRNRIWLDLRDGIDLKALARMDGKAAREEVNSAVEEIARFRNLDLTPSELQQIGKECADDMLGFGPLEELLERDDIADIMINGPDITYIEVKGKIERTHVAFRDNQHLTTICQRIVGAIGRRVDESSPICDARLADGSRVNVIIPPLAVDGACMTIRKFKKDKLTLEDLMGFGSMSPSCAKLIMAIGRCRVNVLVSGGTGSGKTTMLNCLTRYIEAGERIITCEDACELQLQQPHVVRLETRPPNLEGVGEITMRDLVKNCLRMRPERIIVGEVRGPEAFDLLQAMNTGHDGSMGTVHANNPREAISRMENMIAMGGLNLPTSAVREQIASAVNVIIQVQRLRDGSRKTTHVSEITGMEGEVVTMQDLFSLEIEGEDEDGKLITRQKSSGLRPKFFDNARQYGVADMVMDAMEEAYG